MQKIALVENPESELPVDSCDAFEFIERTLRPQSHDALDFADFEFDEETFLED